jgi:hypothetical protein
VTTIPDRDRRQSPRVDLLTEFHGHLITLDEPVRVLQLSPGGMVIAATGPLSPSQEYDLQLTIDDRMVKLKARVVHWRMSMERNDFVYVCGMSFVDPAPEVTALVEAFLAKSAGEAGGPDGGPAGSGDLGHS